MKLLLSPKLSKPIRARILRFLLCLPLPVCVVAGLEKCWWFCKMETERLSPALKMRKSSKKGKLRSRLKPFKIPYIALIITIYTSTAALPLNFRVSFYIANM